MIRSIWGASTYNARGVTNNRDNWKLVTWAVVTNIAPWLSLTNFDQHFVKCVGSFMSSLAVSNKSQLHWVYEPTVQVAQESFRIKLSSGRVGTVSDLVHSLSCQISRTLASYIMYISASAPWTLQSCASARSTCLIKGEFPTSQKWTTGNFPFWASHQAHLMDICWNSPVTSVS